jgi:DNA polymerase III delta prime subunit
MAAAKRIRVDGTTWMELVSAEELRVGDQVTFNDVASIRAMGRVDATHRWNVEALDYMGDTERVAVKSIEAGTETYIHKTHDALSVVVPRPKARKYVRPVEMKWRLLEEVIAKLGADDNEHRMLLYGPPGTGKTRLSVKAALRKGQEVFNVYLTEETAAAELRGHYIPKGSEWHWQHGPVIKAMLGGHRLVVNEINNASGDALDFMLAVADDFEMVQYTLPTGETIFPMPGFQLIATMNGQPDDLPPALQDRFAIRAELTEPHPDAIKRLPEDIQGALLQRMNKGDARFTSVRGWLTFDRLRKSGIDEEDAAVLVFEDAARDVIDALILRRDGKPYQLPVGTKKRTTRRSKGSPLPFSLEG